MLKVNNLIGFGAGLVDPYKNNIVAQSKLRFANGVTSYTDDTGKGVTLINGAQITGQAIDLDGTNDYARFNDTNLTDFDFGTGDFTLEFFIKPVVNYGFQHVCAMLPSTSTQSAGFSFQFGFFSDGDLYIAIGASSLRSSGSFSPFDGDYHHIAVSRTAGEIYLLADGVLLGSATMTTSPATTSGRRLKFGVFIESGGIAYQNSFKGDILSYRITKGVGRYTSDYQVPDVGDYKFPAI